MPNISREAGVKLSSGPQYRLTPRIYNDNTKAVIKRVPACANIVQLLITQQ